MNRVSKNSTLFYVSAIIGFLFFLSSCESTETTLPVYGFSDVVDGDTIEHKIPEFSFMNQDSVMITNDYYSDAIYVSDFFFTSCPTICPKVKAQMMRIVEKYKDNKHVKLLSHSIDTRRDSVPRLKSYADKLGINSEKWSLVTGDKEEIYDIAREYLSVAIEDETVPGGFDHSGNIILVDKEGRIRSFANGTQEDDVTVFLTDIDKLLSEYDWK